VDTVHQRRGKRFVGCIGRSTRLGGRKKNARQAKHLSSVAADEISTRSNVSNNARPEPKTSQDHGSSHGSQTCCSSNGNSIGLTGRIHPRGPRAVGDSNPPGPGRVKSSVASELPDQHVGEHPSNVDGTGGNRGEQRIKTLRCQTQDPIQACSGHGDSPTFVLSKFYAELDKDGITAHNCGRVLRRLCVTVHGSANLCNIHISPKVIAAAKTLNFSANDDRTFVGCTAGITPFAVP
jgi:hypothetical protein